MMQLPNIELYQETQKTYPALEQEGAILSFQLSPEQDITIIQSENTGSNDDIYIPRYRYIILENNQEIPVELLIQNIYPDEEILSINTIDYVTSDHIPNTPDSEYITIEFSTPSTKIKICFLRRQSNEVQTILAKASEEIQPLQGFYSKL